MKILVAVDGSSYTQKAVQYLVSHLNLFQASPEVTLLHVHPPIPGGVAVSRARAIAGNAAVDEHYREEAQAALAPSEAFMREKNIPFTTKYAINSDVANEIDHYAKNHGADLIVIGSHGHGALASAVMGSVATKVISAAPCPVLVVR